VQIALSQALDVLMQVGRGLRHLHRGGVFHRDLAARNVLKKRDGQCKVTDFGLSSVVSSTDAARMTSTTLGPVAWRAPETFHLDDAGRQVASVQTDVYMLGGLMFEVLTAGRHAPFFWMPTERLIMLRGSSPMNTLDVAMAAGVSIPWAIVPGDDWTGAVDGVERLKALMARCLHAEPSRRPSMDDFLAELDAIRDPSSVRDSGYAGATSLRPLPAADRTVTPRDTVVTAAPHGATPPPAVTAQLFDMSDASEELAALEVPADVRNRVCEAMADVADESGNVTGAQLLRIVVDAGVAAVAATSLRRKLRVTAPVPPRTVRCFVATSLRFWPLLCW
jgi:serine/threonine-protein kinase